MNYENFKYIICDDKKRPKHSFDITYSYEEVENEENLAIKLEEPYVIVDLDQEEEFNILYKLIQDRGIKTRVLKTSRGGHFWFKSLSPMKNVVHSNTPLTLEIDVKSWGKKTMEVIKQKGVLREWVHYDNDIDELPIFLKPIASSKKLLHFKEGQGRNDGLFTLIIPLLNAGLSQAEIRTCFELINNYIFDTPLPNVEIEKMFENNKIFENSMQIFYNGKTFLHNTFADYLINCLYIKSYGHDIYFYHNGSYTCNSDVLKYKMLELLPNLKTNDIRETYENIRLKMSVRDDTPDTNVIGLQNGLYNLKTGEFTPPTPTIFNINKLNCTYNPQAFDQEVYDVIKSLACDNQDTINLLVQMLGYFLLNDCRYQKAFILLGNGRNGKSMFLSMIRAWLGDENCASLALEELSDKFKTAELVGKLINIGDDSGHNLLQNTAVFKKLVTGDSITVERKNQQPFKFANKAKMIFAANALPPTTDKSEGFFRRCIIIPFNAVYRETDPDYDENKLDKLITENAKSYLFLIALGGLNSLIGNKCFSTTTDSERMSKNYALHNNTVALWYEENSSVVGNAQELYSHYILYCTRNGLKPIGGVKFKEELRKLKKEL